MLQKNYQPTGSSLPSYLLAEAEYRLTKIKTAQFNKQAMAAQIGVGDLKNSPANTEWSIPHRTERIKQIEGAIQETFEPYLFSLIGNRQHTIKGGIYLPNDNKEYGEEPDATLVLRFNYKRSIIPLKTSVPDANKKATNALQVLDTVIPGFSKFVDAIESNDIPLMPYFHTSQRSIKDGGLDQQALQNFIQQEQVRHSRQPLKMPDGTPVPSAKFYGEHVDRMKNGEAVRPTYQHGYVRKYSNDYIDEIYDHTILMRAIAFKLQQGFAPDWNMVQQAIEAEKNFWTQKHQAAIERNPKIQASYEHFYKMKYKKIVTTFKNGCLPVKGSPGNKDFHWGTLPNDKHRPGLPAEGSGKHIVCPALNVDDMRLILKSLTVVEPNMRGTSTSNADMAPNEFVVPGQKMTYQSNGWDSVPTNPQQNMLVLPAMKQLPTGQVVYDRDQGNMGRVHLTKYWITPTGKGLMNLLHKFGPWADKAWKTLQSQPDIEQLLEQKSKVSSKAWATLLGAGKYGNRTNADNLLDLFAEYPTYDDFYANHLQKGLASEFTAFNKLSDPGFQANSPEAQQAKLLTDQFNSGQMTWKEYTKALAAMQNHTKTKFMTTLSNSEKRSMIGRNDFELLKRFGYPVAKLMDFVYGIMTRSCREVFHNRAGQVTEKMYGRQYSTSTGKSETGQVMLGVRYAFNAPEIASGDPELSKMVRRERGARHIKAPGDMGDINRQTLHPQKGTPLDPQFSDATPANPIFKIVENVTYWVGQTSSTSNWHKPVFDQLPEGMSWDRALDYFIRKYPGISRQLGVLFEPMNVDLQRLQNSSKRALLKVQDKLEQSGHPVTIVYVNKDKQTTILDSEAQAADDFHPNTPGANQNVAPAAPAPAGATPAPIAPSTGPAQPPVSAPVPTTPPAANPADAATSPVVPDPMSKQMPMDSNLERILKRNNDKKLIRNRQSSSDKEAIVKIAQFCDKLDQNHHIDLASQIDNILKEIIK